MVCQLIILKQVVLLKYSVEHCSVTVSGATRCTVLATELTVEASTDKELDAALRLAVESIDYNSKVGTYENEAIWSVKYSNAEQVRLRLLRVASQ